MFNLIVSGGIVSDREGSISSERVFEYTSDALRKKYKPEGQLDLAALCSLPTILMNEGVGGEAVTIGSLSRVEPRRGDLQLYFHPEPGIPRLTNADIYAYASELQIEEWEFSRNHWAIKDVDLFRVLCRKQVPERAMPNVFQLSINPVNRRLVTMMMPFSESFTQVYRVVKGKIEAEKLECRRADDFWQHAHIMQDIIELICTSTVVICDLSEKNPNVFYEAGIAHTLGKEVILITQHMNDVPFDLRSLRCITYLNNAEGREKLANDILARLRTVT